MRLPPLSLYIHLPWCVRKCPYCDFNSHQLKTNTSGLPTLSAELEADYVGALLADLAADLRAWPELIERPVMSVFFGGGTPSLMSPAGYARLFDGLERQLIFDADCEVTLEANPSSVEQARFEGYRAAGINRLSIGVQSFQQRQLALLGRVHSSAQAYEAIAAAHQAGFDRVNIDLMHGLPEQSPEGALEDLRTALSLAPSHLSWYQLTLEPNTVFYRQPPVLPEEDILVEIQDAGQALILEAGYQHYEVSAYAKPGQQARHNLNYWTFGDYLGLGAGAHGKLSRWDDQAAGGLMIERRWKTRQPEAYLARHQSSNNLSTILAKDEQGFLAGTEQLSAAQRPIEFMLNALRLAEGVPAALYQARTGLFAQDLSPILDALRARELWTEDPERLACSPLGWRFLNTVLEPFFQD
ncbi:radical SAM family heme chaperone HemW [Marinospirillum sp.]|uniref:radical SAM family heme chaperone HemW n=1 Tax=Marinospirillum sp. TaxID=2183934 RepID=UPI003A8464D5